MIGYPGPCLSRNLPSAYQYPQVVSETLTNKVQLGKVAGPFTSPSLPNPQVSPIGVIPKKRSDEFNLIFQLS